MLSIMHDLQVHQESLRSGAVIGMWIFCIVPHQLRNDTTHKWLFIDSYGGAFAC